MFLRRGAVGVFDGSIHFIEEGEVIKIALCIGERRSVERIARVESDGAGHGLRVSEFETRQVDVANKDLFAFINVEDDIDLAGI